MVRLCPGLRAGMEGAIHAVCELFDLHSDDSWGGLFVNARNAFNSVDHVAALWNARILWLLRMFSLPLQFLLAISQIVYSGV